MVHKDGVLEMAYRTRINYTPAQKAEMWDRWRRGESLKDIGRVLIGHPRRSSINWCPQAVFDLSPESDHAWR
jgi:hypothetical protein